MRTTLTIDDDVLDAARRIADDMGRPLGRVVSDLARQALMPRARVQLGDGLPTFTVPDGTRPIDPVDVAAAQSDW